MKVNEKTGEVKARLVLKKNKVTRKWRVKYERTDRLDKIDSRFDTRRSPFKLKKLHPRNIGVIYLYATAWLLFSLWVPSTWLTWLTHRSVINQQSILIVVALGLLVPLSAGVFDLSIAATVSASAVTVSWLLVDRQWGVIPAILVALMLGLSIGALNGFLIVRVKIDSFIATLGVSSVLTAYSVWRSGNRSILGLPDSFKAITDEFAFGLTRTVVIAIVLAMALWYMFEHTALGRYFFATGGGKDAARLAGVHTDRFISGAMITSAIFSSVAGILLSSQFGSVQAQSGAPYLLPSFSAAFLGATQFKRRFNVFGTVLSVVALQSGVKGLQLAGVGSVWVESLFFGCALIISVGLSTFQKRVHGGQRRWWRREESGPEYLLGRLMGWGPRKINVRDADTNNVDESEDKKNWWHDPSDSEAHHHKP